MVHLRKIFSPEWVDFMREAFTEALHKPGPNAEFIASDTTWATLYDEKASEREFEMFQDQEVSRRLPSWRAIARDSGAAGLIARLMTSATATFFYEHLILKRASVERAIPWHQDLPYWKVDGNMIGSVWIPLDPMPEVASVRYIEGSHRWGLFRPRHFVDASPYEGVEHFPPLPPIDEMLASGEIKAASFDVEPGDAVCFNARTVHGSPGNSDPSNRDHRRVALRFGGDDAVYCDRPGETAIPTPQVDRAAGLRHGEPLACEVFPKVWPRVAE